MLRRVEGEGAYATLALAGELSRAGLSGPDRGLATELAYGVLRQRGRIDRAIEALAPRGTASLSPALRAALRVATYQILFLDRVPSHAAVDDAVSAARKIGGPKIAGFANGLLRRLARDGEPALPDRRDLVAHLEASTSTPRWILAELEAAVGADELEAAATALAAVPPVWGRRTRRATGALLVGEPGQAVASNLVPGAVRIEGLGSPEDSPSFQRGEWTVQDLGAQLVALLAAPSPGQRVLDACAGVGGKSVHLAELADDRATIDAVDLSRRKLDLLADSVRRLGLSSVTPHQGDVLVLPDALASRYDLAVLDAPCSGLGVLRRHPEAKWRLGADAPAAMAGPQRAMLDAVAARVAPGGALVYSVCTFAVAEGAAQARDFLARHPEFTLARPPGELPAWAEVISEDGFVRTFPHRQDADAFFAARFERR